MEYFTVKGRILDKSVRKHFKTFEAAEGFVAEIHQLGNALYKKIEESGERLFYGTKNTMENEQVFALIDREMEDRVENCFIHILKQELCFEEDIHG